MWQAGTQVWMLRRLTQTPGSLSSWWTKVSMSVLYCRPKVPGDLYFDYLDYLVISLFLILIQTPPHVIFPNPPWFSVGPHSTTIQSPTNDTILPFSFEKRIGTKSIMRNQRDSTEIKVPFFHEAKPKWSLALQMILWALLGGIPDHRFKSKLWSLPGVLPFPPPKIPEIFLQ